MQSKLSPSVNYWPQDACAKAFWSQHETPAYRRLLATTTEWLDPQPGERWLDLGCGCGQLTEALWVKSGGRLAEVVALDCAAANEKSIHKLCQQVRPTPRAGVVRFVHANFSAGLESWEDGSFDGVVSGLALQYADFFDQATGRWTTQAYDRLLAETYRVLRPGGRLVFSVNVPEPAWWRITLGSWAGVFRTRQPVRFVKNCLRMLRYGAWLKQQARLGRFHYLPHPTVTDKLSRLGFEGIEHRLGYARQAYLFRCRKAAGKTLKAVA